MGLPGEQGSNSHVVAEHVRQGTYRRAPSPGRLHTGANAHWTIPLYMGANAPSHIGHGD
jgi:hypothetical protein